MNDKNLGGAPIKDIDFNILDNLIAIFCTGEECAGVLEIDYDTLNTRIKEKFNIGFSEYFKKRNAKGKASLRRKQYALLDKNVAMAIWLGKQYLDQKDLPLIDQSSHLHLTNNVNLEEFRKLPVQDKIRDILNRK